VPRPASRARSRPGDRAPWARVGRGAGRSGRAARGRAAAGRAVTSPARPSVGAIAPRVSVIVPTLNESPEIEATLRCAREDGPHELIVVDGGSADDTVERATKLADRVLGAASGRA